MKKFTFIFCLLLSFTWVSTTYGQTEQGRYLLGGSLRGQFNKGGSFSLAPNFAYFVIDNFAFGGAAQVTTGNGTNFAIGPLARYYFNTGSDKIKPFGQLFAGLSSNSPEVGSSSTGLAGNVAAGVAFFLNEHVAIEPDLRVDFDTRERYDYTSGVISFNIGFQIYLP